MRGKEGVLLYGYREGARFAAFQVFSWRDGSVRKWEGEFKAPSFDAHLMKHSSGGIVRLRIGDEAHDFKDARIESLGDNRFSFHGQGEAEVSKWDSLIQTPIAG